MDVKNQLTRSGILAAFTCLLLVGTPAVANSCMQGRVVDPLGTPLVGAEVLVVQYGGIGPRRARADNNGEFCLPTRAGEEGQYTVWGWSPTVDTVYTLGAYVAGGSEAGTCLAQNCLNLGDLTPDPHLDFDEDGYYGGVGDCDDYDEGVNPSPAFGDGSACYDEILVD